MKSFNLNFLLLTVCSFGGGLTYAQDISVTCPVLPSADGQTKSVSRAAEFNWSFQSANGGDVQIGQYACGSYWVAPAVGDTGVRVISLSGSDNPGQVDLLSLDADPITEKMGLLDGSNNYGNYVESENELPQLPKVFTPPAGSCISLVAAMQRNETQTGGSGTSSTRGESTDAYNVVTLLAEAPADNGINHIRPNITGATKELLTWDDFDLSQLGSTDIPDELDTDEIEAIRQAWVHNTEIFGFAVLNDSGEDLNYSEGGRAYRGHIVSDEYASSMAASFHESVIRLCNSYNSLEEKRPALAALLAYGLDSYHCKFNHGDAYPKLWNSGAGQWVGQYSPVVFLAALSNQEEKKETVKRVSAVTYNENRLDRGPQLLYQIKRGQTGVLLWGDAHVIVRDGSSNVAPEDRRYWADLKESKAYIGAPADQVDTSVGARNRADPYGYIDGPGNAPGSSYMAVVSGGFENIAACMIVMPEFRRIVGTDNPIEFADRLRSFGTWCSPDPIAAVDQRDLDCSPFHYGVSPHISHYCDLRYWRTTWGPSAEDPSIGIEGGGRFNPAMFHGKKIDSLNGAPTVNAKWDEIIALYDGERYQDRLVGLDEVTRPDVIIAGGMAYIMTGTHNATIYYTLDGSKPDENSNEYTGPFTIPEGSTLSVIALKEGKTDSDIYTISLAAPLTPQDLDPRFQMLGIGLSEGSNMVEINYMRSQNLAGVVYSIEHSTDMKKWETVENAVLTPSTNSLDIDRVKAEIPVVGDGGSRFYRIRISSAE